MEDELDVTKLKYVLYARKSTDDPQRQVRSIPDQVAECKQLAQRLGLHIIDDPIVEKQSAKKPNRRPKFRQMLNDIKSGKYDAILAWNPDRLARNMKEGGEIIDMVDENIIKDMKFVTHHFSKDANGKMLLGMAFVLSKQYSDNLSQNVTRGVRRNLQEGKTPTPKHGYIRDERGLYVPDGKNFELMCEAWQMRRKGTSLEEIATYMNNNGYGRLVKKTGTRIQMDKRMLSDIFKDPFYYGILIQAGKEVDVRLIYDFQPATTEQGYLEVQALPNNRFKPYKQRRFTFYPFKMMIVCAVCGNHMYSGASKGHLGERYLYYRCDNEFCSRKKKSIRSKVILKFIYKFLKDGLNFTEKDYNDYYKGITKITDVKREKLSIELHSQQARLKTIDKEIGDRSLAVVDFAKDSTVRKRNENRIAELEGQEEPLKETIGKLKKQLSNPEQDKLSLTQFLNLSKNAAVIVKSANAVIKDIICRYVFLNLTVDEEKVASYQLKEPFATMMKQRQQHTSRGERN